MGANTFIDLGIGRDAEEAFRRLVADAAYQHGHGGYTGTVAEKHDFVVLDLPDVPGMSPSELAEHALAGLRQATEYVRRGGGTYEGGAWVRELDQVVPIPAAAAQAIARVTDAVDDKWGPAGCFEVTHTDEGREALSRWVEEQRRYGAFTVVAGSRVRVGPEPTTEGLRVFLFFGWASS